MSGIFGVAAFEQHLPVSADAHTLAVAMSRWGRPCDRRIPFEGVAFGQVLTANLPESPFDSPPQTSADPTRALLVAAGRLDNRDELCDRLAINAGIRRDLSDGGLMQRAFDRWGEDCAASLTGDWSFAAWDPAARRLVLVVDQFGNTGLFYARVGQRVAFASDPGALRNLPWIPRTLDIEHLARVLSAAPDATSTATILKDVKWVPPAHAVTVTSAGISIRRYWRMDDVVPAAQRGAPDYAAGMLDVVREAVQARVRSDGAVASTLSAGLDSATVTVLAARELAAGGRRLTALTAVPSGDTSWAAEAGILADEGPLASIVAAAEPNIDHLLIDSRAVTPIQGLREALRIFGEPFHAAANAYWLVAMLAEAKRRDIRVLLTGQRGNFALSWAGGRPSAFKLLRRHGMVRAARRAIKDRLPIGVARRFTFRKYWKRWDLDRHPWRPVSAVGADLAHQVGLKSIIESADAVFHVPSETPSERVRLMEQSTRQGGARWQQLGAAFGMVVRDPSQDIRVTRYSLAIPSDVWIGPMDRWMIRRATEGVLPDAVRLNRRRGQQAADLIDRLRQHPVELEEAFAEAESSALARYCVDLPYCRQVAAAALQQPIDGPLFLATGTILLRGLTAALFLADFERGTVHD